MNKIRVIDLLNKIANNEEVPRKIKINNIIYEYIGYMYCTEKANYQDIEDYLFGKWNFNILNDEVEILNEEKEDKIQKIYHCETCLTQNEVEIFITENLNQMVDKINELIDEVNKLKEK